MADSAETVMQRYLSAFERRAPEEMIDLLHEDVECIYPPDPAWNLRGKEPLAVALRDYFKSYPDVKLEWRIEKTEPEPGGSAVSVHARYHAVATGHDRHVHARYVVADGRIIAVHDAG